MAKLTAEQKKAVSQWAAEVATLNDIQDCLKRDCSITLTYMDTRLLVMELGLKLQDKPKEKLPEPETPAAPAEAPMADDFDGGGQTTEAELMPPSPTGSKVSVSVDVVNVPGTMVSGKATFSDGKTADWHLDQFGRLGLHAAEPGYQPPPADIPVFQRELQRLLQQQGF